MTGFLAALSNYVQGGLVKSGASGEDALTFDPKKAGANGRLELLQKEFSQFANTMTQSGQFAQTLSRTLASLIGNQAANLAVPAEGSLENAVDRGSVALARSFAAGGAFIGAGWSLRRLLADMLQFQLPNIPLFKAVKREQEETPLQEVVVDRPNAGEDLQEVVVDRPNADARLQEVVVDDTRNIGGNATGQVNEGLDLEE